MTETTVSSVGCGDINNHWNLTAKLNYQFMMLNNYATNRLSHKYMTFFAICIEWLRQVGEIPSSQLVSCMDLILGTFIYPPPAYK